MAQVAVEDDAEGFVRALFALALKREPRQEELGAWMEASSKLAPSALLAKMLAMPEYAKRGLVRPFFADGHFHSPVVDPATISSYVAERAQPSSFAGIELDADEMARLWSRMAGFIQQAPFPERKQPEFRFFFEGSPFPYGDALALHAMIGLYRPRRIVEIGSGFSTACMLDSAEIHGVELDVTCIEPYPDRLKKLLRPLDSTMVTLIEKPVQEVPVETVAASLQPNDILFIDSTHVLKTASDVHYELMELIPAVKPGVLIHIHDCPYPFEYPSLWLERNYSWNEVYALRTFLMYNTSFKILFWGSFFKRSEGEKVKAEGGAFAKNGGTSIWLVRTS